MILALAACTNPGPSNPAPTSAAATAPTAVSISGTANAGTSPAATATSMPPAAASPGAATPRPASATAVASTPGATSVPRFEPGQCAFALGSGQVDGQNVRCGSVVVPELHQQPNGKTLRLAVAILKTSGSAAPEPLVILQGGPGGSSQDILRAFGLGLLPANSLLKNRDLIIFDQRGVGKSEPALDCPEDRDYEALTQARTPQQESERSQSNLLKCRDRLAQAGINLAAYNSVENAADVNDLRAALGYNRIDLYGASYGTRLALEVMRDFPQILRSVILDATLPLQANPFVDGAPTFDRSLNQLFSDCQADLVCNLAYPDLKGDLSRAIAQLNTKPATLNLTNPHDGKSYAVVLDGRRFLSLIFQGLYSDQVIPLLPAIVGQARSGQFALLTVIANAVLFQDLISEGMYLSVMCGEEASFSSADEARAAAQNVLPEIRDLYVPEQELAVFSVCAQWPAKKAAPRENEAVRSDLPTLILHGTLDPALPPSYGQLAAQTLSRSTYVEFRGLGHVTLFALGAGGQCSVGIAQSFLADPSRAPDTSCTQGLRSVFLPVPG